MNRSAEVKFVARAALNYAQEFRGAKSFRDFGFATERFDGALAVVDDAMAEALRALIRQLRKCRSEGNAAAVLRLADVAIARGERPAQIH